MHEDKFIGRTLREVAKKSAPGSKGYVVFILRDTQDDTGKRIGWCAKVGHLLHKYPGLAACKVKIAYDYYGETILRVLEEHRGKSKNVRNE